MLIERKIRCLQTYGMENGLDVFNWWMENGVLPGQEVLEEFRESCYEFETGRTGQGAAVLRRGRLLVPSTQ
ncbi:MAG: hypothetical protein ACLR8L_00160 [Oscillospiraceae bacterium]